MKKIFSLILIALISFGFVGCGINKTNKPPIDENKPPIDNNETEDTNGTFRTVDFINKSTEYNIDDSEIALYFNKDSQLPFVNIVDYLLLLDGLYLSEEFEFLYDDEILKINVLITYEEEDYEETLTIDSQNDTVHVTNLLFFDLYMESTETNYGEGLVDLEATVVEGSEITFNLATYDFDVLLIDSKFYMPLAITNLLFNQSNYFDTYYNGETLYGIDTSQIEEADLKTILKSDANNDLMSDELKLANYNFYTLIIDYFYGLKNERNIDKANTFVKKEEFLNGDVEKNIFNVTEQLDDLHTSHMTRGFYNNKNQSTSYATNYEGPNIKSFWNGVSQVQNEAAKHFGTDFRGYIKFTDHEYFSNNTLLVIYVMGFTVETPNEIEAIIKNAHTNTKDIVIDLAFNTGGNLGAVLRMFTLMTNKTIEYHLKNPLDGQTATYRLKGEKEAYDQYNYYFKISSITFSAANLTASIAKELGFKVIGRKSSGGASAISFFVFPTGSIIVMSSNSVLSTKDYVSIENGITPDFMLTDVYSEQQVVTAINSFK